MKSPLVFLCSLKTKMIYLRDRWIYVNTINNNNNDNGCRHWGELLVEFWMCCDGCCAMLVGFRLCFCCDDAFLYSCDENKCKKKIKPDATLSQLFFCISPSTACLITPESLHLHTMAEHVSGKSSGNNFAAFGMLSKRIRNLSESIFLFKTECIEVSGKILL